MRENRTYGSMRGGGGKTRTDNYGRFNRGRTTPPTLLAPMRAKIRARSSRSAGALQKRPGPPAFRPSPLNPADGFASIRKSFRTNGVGGATAPLAVLAVLVLFAA